MKLHILRKKYNNKATELHIKEQNQQQHKATLFHGIKTWSIPAQQIINLLESSFLTL